MSYEIVLSNADKSAYQEALEYCTRWCSKHQAEIGVAEMALGAGMLSWGVMNGPLNIGKDLFASSLADLGAATGFGAGLTGGSLVALTLLKGIFVGGVVGVQGVTNIPALALIGGATAILGAFGYVGGDLVQRVIDPPMGYGELLANGSVLVVGAALMIDGARRIIGDQRVLELASSFKDGVIHLSSQATTILARSKSEFDKLVTEFDESTSAKLHALAGGAAGAAAGVLLAGTTVTVLGSQALGAAALSLGLVSAPVWPVVAGAAAGLALGVAAWKGVKHLSERQSRG